MPIYEYDCPKCGVFEVMQKITEKPLEKCPKCNRKVKKLISQSSFHLKGTGWYATDYSSKSDGGNGKNKQKDYSSETDSATKSTGSEAGDKKASTSKEKKDKSASSSDTSKKD